MPGLSQYKDTQILDVNPELTGSHHEFHGDASIFDRMRQRQEESRGFSDIKRTAPSWMQREMLNNIPRSEWDKPTRARTQGEPQEIAPDMWVPNPELSEEFTLREIMEMLNKLTPNEQQGP